MPKRSDILCLFDVDGTLTMPRLVIEPEMTEFMKKLREECVIGVVGGSDFVKIEEQMNSGDGSSVLDKFDFTFSENGLMAHKAKDLLAIANIKKELGDDVLQDFINFCLEYRRVKTTEDYLES